MKAAHKKHEEHKMKRAAGGGASWYAGGGSNVAKEAEEKKHGGKVKRKHGGEVEGHKSKKRMDRPGRKRGGGVGADLTPMSTASKEKQAQGHTTEKEPD